MSSEKVDEKHVDVEKQKKPSFAPDLAHNVNAKIQNPLHGLTKDELFTEVDVFCREKGMEDKIELFRKGALVAQHPSKFEEVEELDESEKQTLRDEIIHKWRQPSSLIFTVVLCSLAAAVQGWDQTGSNGANLSFPVEFDIAEDDPVHGSRNQWLVGVINAGPYLACVFPGCWLTDPLNNYLGRRGTIFFCGIFCTISVIGSGFAQNWYQLFICRLLLGLGMGPKASTVPVYAAENTPAAVRGGLVMSWQMWTAFGIFLGYSANLAVMNTGRIAWRLQLGSAFIPAIPMTIGVFFCPESPRWLMKKGRYAEAYHSFTRLRNTELQAARDMFYTAKQLAAEFEVLKGSTYWSRITELFTIPRVRRATIASGVVMIAQQMCGINIIAFYSSTVFVRAGYNDHQALWASWGFGLVNWLFAFPAVWTIDTFGRRNLLLFTFPNMAWTLLVAGLCFLIPTSSPASVPLVALFIFMFAAFYSPGEGPVPFTYSAEVFPLTHREVGMSWAVMVCLGFAAVLSITFPRMVGAMTIVGAFCFYAGLNVIAFVMIFFLLPETKQRTLEELDYVFAVPMRTHANYQLTKFLPYFIKRYVFCGGKKVTLEPLYNFDEVESITVFEKGTGH
ncbi:hypothetical protein DL96DRAFT_1603621 [Flagelloscypha sp. PMI_526]|nr:hypothetical protein DL96DRAFT_1603621 [Flagelloscypha sp. PMI_526]